MEDLFGILFLLGLGLLAGLRKLAEYMQSKREDAEPSQSADELPERTRQILFGEGDAAARQAEEQSRRAAEAAQRTAKADVPPVRRQGPLAPTREAVEATMRQTREQHEQARLRERQQRAAAQRQAEAPRRKEPSGEGDAQQRRRELAVASYNRQQQERLTVGRRRVHRSRMFANLGEVRRGIIMSEVLGPPKGNV